MLCVGESTMRPPVKFSTSPFALPEPTTLPMSAPALCVIVVGPPSPETSIAAVEPMIVPVLVMPPDTVAPATSAMPISVLPLAVIGAAIGDAAGGDGAAENEALSVSSADGDADGTSARSGRGDRAAV